MGAEREEEWCRELKGLYLRGLAVPRGEKPWPFNARIVPFSCRKRGETTEGLMHELHEPGGSVRSVLPRTGATQRRGTADGRAEGVVVGRERKSGVSHIAVPPIGSVVLPSTCAAGWDRRES